VRNPEGETEQDTGFNELVCVITFPVTDQLHLHISARAQSSKNGWFYGKSLLSQACASGGGER